MSKQLLIIGKPHSSKTVFMIQFYIRLQKGKSKLTLYKPVDDLTAIIEGKDALVKGDEPEPTDPGRSVSMTLPISFRGTAVDLKCPDYGGEQINTVLSSRLVDKRWTDSIRESNNWIFFIRLNSISKHIDLSNITVTEHHTKGQKAERAYITTEQSSLLELMQIFLHVKGHDYHTKNRQVKLTVALTCWDELHTDAKPRAVLREHLPLLLNFIESNWGENNLNFVGLSALEFPISDPVNKERYRNEGCESFGYLVDSNGQRIDDLTELIAEAL